MDDNISNTPILCANIAINGKSSMLATRRNLLVKKIQVNIFKHIDNLGIFFIYFCCCINIYFSSIHWEDTIWELNIFKHIDFFFLCKSIHFSTIHWEDTILIFTTVCPSDSVSCVFQVKSVLCKKKCLSVLYFSGEESGVREHLPVRKQVQGGVWAVLAALRHRRLGTAVLHHTRPQIRPG